MIPGHPDFRRNGFQSVRLNRGGRACGTGREARVAQLGKEGEFSRGEEVKRPVPGKGPWGDQATVTSDCRERTRTVGAGKGVI